MSSDRQCRLAALVLAIVASGGCAPAWSEDDDRAPADTRNTLAESSHTFRFDPFGDEAGGATPSSCTAPLRAAASAEWAWVSVPGPPWQWG
jgi:hypothetical protein